MLEGLSACVCLCVLELQQYINFASDSTLSTMHINTNFDISIHHVIITWVSAAYTLVKLERERWHVSWSNERAKREV